MPLFGRKGADRRVNADDVVAHDSAGSAAIGPNDPAEIIRSMRRADERALREIEQLWDGAYPFPLDDSEHESDRLNRLGVLLARARIQLGWGNPLHLCPPSTLAPRPDRPTRILDVGCGTGAWALEMAARYPHADVVGVDILPPDRFHLSGWSVSNPALLRTRLPNFLRRTYNMRIGAPFDGQSFDLIRLCGMGWAVPLRYYSMQLGIYARCLRDGGYMEIVECATPELPGPGGGYFPVLKHWNELVVMRLGPALGISPQIGAVTNLKRGVLSSLVFDDQTTTVTSLPIPMSLSSQAAPLAHEAAECFLAMAAALRGALARTGVVPAPTIPNQLDEYDLLLREMRKELETRQPGVIWRWTAALARLDLHGAPLPLAPDQDRPQQGARGRTHARLAAGYAQSDPAIGFGFSDSGATSLGPVGVDALPEWLRAPAPDPTPPAPPAPPPPAFQPPRYPPTYAPPTLYQEPPGGWLSAATLVDGPEPLPPWLLPFARHDGSGALDHALISPQEPPDVPPAPDRPRDPWERERGERGERR